MFDIGWSEFLVIAVVALIAIGPKELPGVLRMLGQWVAKIRGMAADFQGQFREAMREAELSELKKEFDDAANTLNTQVDQYKNPGGIWPDATTSPDAGNAAAPASTEPVISPVPPEPVFASPPDAPSETAPPAEPKFEPVKLEAANEPKIEPETGLKSEPKSKPKSKPRSKPKSEPNSEPGATPAGGAPP